MDATNVGINAKLNVLFVLQGFVFNVRLDIFSINLTSNVLLFAEIS